MIGINNSLGILIIISFSIALITQILTLLYLGTSFSNNKDLLVDDWKRKWLIFFAYLTIIVSFLTNSHNSYYSSVTSVIAVMSSTIILCYLGTSFNNDTNTIKSDKWERRWLIVMAYINIICIMFCIMFCINIIFNFYQISIAIK